MLPNPLYGLGFEVVVDFTVEMLGVHPNVAHTCEHVSDFLQVWTKPEQTGYPLFGVWMVHVPLLLYVSIVGVDPRLFLFAFSVHPHVFVHVGFGYAGDFLKACLCVDVDAPKYEHVGVWSSWYFVYGSFSREEIRDVDEILLCKPSPLVSVCGTRVVAFNGACKGDDCILHLTQ